MANKIAQSYYETAPTEDIAVADVYTDKSATPVNKSKPNEITEAAKGVARALQQNTKITDLAHITKVEDGKAGIDKNAAADLIRNVTGGPNSAMGTLKDATLNAMLGAVGFKTDAELAAAAGAAGVPGQSTAKTPKGYMTVSGLKTIYSTYQTVSKLDLNSAQGITAMLNSVTGNSGLAKVLDMESQFAVLGKIVSKLSELGIPQAIDEILAKLENDKERRRLMIENLQNFVYQSDLIAINKVIDYVGPQGCFARVPKIINMIMTFYRYPIGVGTPNDTLKTALINTLARLDPKWYLYNRDGTDVSNLEPFTYASPDALALMMIPVPTEAPFTVVTNVYYIPALIAQTYPSRDIIEIMQEDFPHAVLETPKLYK